MIRRRIKLIPGIRRIASIFAGFPIVLTLSRIALLCCGLISLAPFFAEAGPGRPVELKYADSLRVRTTPFGVFRELIGNVRLVQDSVTVTCDRAVQNIRRNRVDLEGNVKFVQGSVTLITPRGNYDGARRIASGVGGVTLRDRNTILLARRGSYDTQAKIARFSDSVAIENDSLVIFTDYLTYYRNSQDSYARGNVIALAKHSGAVLTGDSLTNIPGRAYTVALGNPVMCRSDTSWTTAASDSSRVLNIDTLCIAADTLESIRADSTERYYARSRVRLTRNSLSAQAGLAIYDIGAERIDLYKTPRLWLDSTQLTADSIEVRVPGKQLRLVQARGSAFAATRSEGNFPERIDQLSGSTIDILVERDTLQGILAGDEAYSLTFRYKEDLPDGLIRNAADTVKIWFDAGAPDRAVAIREVDASYTPEFLLSSGLSEYNLRNFTWFEDRPRVPLPSIPERPRPWQLLPDNEGNAPVPPPQE